MSGDGALMLEEPRFSDAVRGVLARAARQPIRTLAVAALSTAMVVALRASRHPTYVAALTFRMAEGELLTPGSAPKAPALIRDYIADVALNRERLLQVMEKHGLSSGRRQIDPAGAVASLREDIEIEVVRNYFLFDREAGGEPRSAKILLSFTGGDRDQVQAVLHDIGAIFLQSQAAARASHLAQERDVNDALARHTRAELQRLEARRARLLLRQAHGVALAEVRAELSSLQSEIDGLLQRRAEIEGRGADLEFVREAEQQRLWLSFELIDESVRAIRTPLRGAGLVGYALLVSSFMLSAWAIMIGAFDRRIHGAVDVTSRGFPLLGALPRFPGANALPLRVRLKPSAGGRQESRA